MRVVVEQIAANTDEWIEKLIEAGLISKQKIPKVSVLMGGEIDRDRMPARLA